MLTAFSLLQAIQAAHDSVAQEGQCRVNTNTSIDLSQAEPTRPLVSCEIVTGIIYCSAVACRCCPARPADPRKSSSDNMQS